jgi:hypothetical protein
LTAFHGDDAKKIFFEKKEFKMANSKKLSFSKASILNILLTQGPIPEILTKNIENRQF